VSGTSAPVKAASADRRLRAEDREVIAALRVVLDDAGYTVDGLSSVLQAGDVAPSDAREVPFFRRRLPRGEPLTTLIELFHFGLAVDRADAMRAFDPVPLDRLVQTRLLTDSSRGVRARVALQPFEKLLVVSDHLDERGYERRDHVLDVTMPSLVLASVTVRRPVESALDLGTGCGVQAFLAARHADRIVAVDVNQRALDYAAFGARLNGISNLELLFGDLYEPVAGELFDLILANPPYVVSPDTTFLFRDGSEPGDSLCERLVKRAPSFLREGGFAHLVINWAHRANEDWSAPLRRWVARSGCDALLLHHVSQDPLEYAALWNSELRRNPAAYAHALDRWTEYHRQHEIEAIAFGAVVLRRRNGANWVRSEELSSDLLHPAGHHILRLIENEDLLAARDERALLKSRLQLAPDHQFDQTGRFGPDGGEIEGTILRLENGLRTRVALDANTAMVLARLDGSRTLGEALLDAAADAGESAPSRDRFLEAGPAAVRRLLELGFVVPVDDPKLRAASE